MIQSGEHFLYGWIGNHVCNANVVK
uniref:Uncharacterized protein n=1 Tax=Anguilla anguilla TaxID=7936 RepID=A0A0E9SBZ9_ANGAN